MYRSGKTHKMLKNDDFLKRNPGANQGRIRVPVQTGREWRRADL
jgi:hypothetical protein